jgi:AhpD family alkylhydroperoxidase
MKHTNLNILFEEIPNTAESFKKFHDSVFQNGALSEKQKELIATAISVALRCSPCINTHTRKALELGNSKEEIAETISIGFLMGGGPAFAYASEALELLRSISKNSLTNQPKTQSTETP